MNIRSELEKIMEAYITRTISAEAWQVSIAELLKNYDPLEIAIILKEFYHMDAEGIAYAMHKISGEYPAVTVGAILLNERIYPKTTKEEMQQILKKVFPQEDIQKAVQILYPAYVTVDARIYWYDTGVDIDSDELLTVTYKGGLWNINPSQPSCDGDGIRIIAKPGYALPGRNEGCLVGKIGNGDPEYIGNHSTFLGLRKGRLYLAANDDIHQRYGAGYKDNSGNIQVEIKKELR